MGDLVNLRQIRKRAARAADERKAEDNRIRHGLTKRQRDDASVERSTQDRRLDGMRIVRSGAESGGVDGE
ncbi:DUF4169 family protein [Aureimonas pseudogalii]|uniref:DUF4169 family protein n=1 Tax=Aureimonas pseudogalii TaxID=1744844 RepID=A0A7W6EBV0_9HYPH|nr:DUF4169 family protein [Aureimonas pseudogalii]MBB3998481.1 hypothetical protein [Aureimonas pseudogalii]